MKPEGRKRKAEISGLSLLSSFILHPSFQGITLKIVYGSVRALWPPLYFGWW